MQDVEAGQGGRVRFKRGHSGERCVVYADEREVHLLSTEIVTEDSLGRVDRREREKESEKWHPGARSDRVWRREREMPFVGMKERKRDQKSNFICWQISAVNDSTE